MQKAASLRIPEQSWPAVVTTLRMLRESRELAVSGDHDPWSLAVEQPYLLAGGSSITVLRWLLLEKLIEHKIEITRPGTNQRQFQLPRSLRFGSHSCFVVSDKGLAVVLQSGCAPQTVLTENGVREKRTGKNAGKTKPHWNRHTRQLTVHSVLVKHFRVPAANQEQLLLAFQRQNWRRCILDPLPSSFDPRKRLLDVVRRLNERQRVPLLRFHTSDSSGAVWWELLEFPAEKQLSC